MEGERSTKNRTLVAYFSRVGENYFGGNISRLSIGSTEIVAKAVAEQTGGDVFKIEPLIKYPDNYQSCLERASSEQKSNARPELELWLSNIDDYDFIFLGFPIWYNTMPMAVWTFLEHYDFAKKYIYPFCTHEGSRMGQSEADVKRLCPGAVVARGLPLHGSEIPDADRFVASWLRGLSVCPK